MELTKNLTKNKKLIKKVLPIDKSFDVLGRDLTFGNTDAYFVFIDGFAKDDIMVYVLENLQKLEGKDTSVYEIKDWLKKHIVYIEVDTFTDMDKMQNFVLAGAAALIIDGLDEGIILDVRTYPARGPQEPDLEKVTRGSRDGLVETIIFNTALIRRRIRDSRLIYNMKTVGKRSKTDVVVAHIDGLVDTKLLDEIYKQLDNIQVDSLLMGEKTLEELLIKKKWYNPLPQTRFTERPDVVAAHLLEGHIALIVDNSPSVMLLPTTLFHFTQHSEDYYQNPLVGTYIRWIRLFSMIASYILTPIYLLIIYNQDILPTSLQFLIPEKMGSIPLILQFLILEIGLDILRIASIHTPNTLSTSLGIIGGLLLSEFAIKAGWFIPETVLYMAAVGIGTFATPSIEFALAIRIFRLFILILTGLFKTTGFIIGVLITLFIIFTTKTFSGIRYTWPLIPFNGKALSNVLFRKPIIEIKRNNSNK